MKCLLLFPFLYVFQLIVVNACDVGEHIDRNRARDGTAEEPMYSVVSSGSTNKLTLKISKAKIDESKATGVKRQWSDDNGAERDQSAIDDGGAFSSTLSERVKRRKRIITYREDGQSDDEAGDGAINSKSAGVWDDAKLKKTPKPFDVNDVGVDDPVMAGVWLCICLVSRTFWIKSLF